MEGDRRPFQPVKLDIIGTESGRQRYFRDGWLTLPPVADWRNNLTACSQRYNLYFLAHQEKVAVFQPSLPLHHLENRPRITIIPVLANANAHGILDPSRPHCINHLIIGELGSEEILLLSTDSGNVAAYYTAAIQDFIDKEPYKFDHEAGSDSVGIRPFFIHWVYESAWGLSIHKNARMLAVSSNQPFFELTVGVNAAVTVFAFALTDSDGHAGRLCSDKTISTRADGSEWNLWAPDAANPTRLPDRSRNWKTRLEGHTCNIPSISFVNTDNDREGKYLLSTDIEGVTICWHIWRGTAISTWDFSPSMHTSFNTYNVPQTFRGWSVLALDPSSFQVVDTFEEFLGGPAELTEAAGYFDITDTLYKIPGVDRPLRVDAMLSHDSDRYLEDHDILHEFNGDLSDEVDQDPASVGLSDGPRSTGNVEPGSAGYHLHSASDERRGSGLDGMDGLAAEEAATDDITMVDSNLAEDDELPLDWPRSTMPAGYSSHETRQSRVGTGRPKKINLSRPRTVAAPAGSSSRGKGLEIPALHLSASHLRLFTTNSPRQASVYCPDLLSLQKTAYYAASMAIDRLNMTQYIPDLGIVVVGSQAGRVAVCTLTRKGSEGPFGLRVDWILPFSWQERKRERPFTHLLGIAAGPAQEHVIPRSSSVSEDDDDIDSQWLQDRVEQDGLSITFDPNILRLGRNDSKSTRGGAMDEAGGRPPRKRGRPRKPRRIPLPRPEPPVEHQAWPSRSEAAEASGFMGEAWRGIDYSPRYRLMLTYRDQTVMTYELSRMRPFMRDPGSGIPNWRNLADV